jgi:quinol monooxygenase YgiN
VQFVLLKRYDGDAGLAAHRASAHCQAYRAKLPELTAEPIDVTVRAPVNLPA